MADESERVGDSSSDFLLNVQKSVRELMRASLQFKDYLSEGKDDFSDTPALIR